MKHIFKKKENKIAKKKAGNIGAKLYVTLFFRISATLPIFSLTKNNLILFSLSKKKRKSKEKE